MLKKDNPIDNDYRKISQNPYVLSIKKGLASSGNKVVNGIKSIGNIFKW